MPRLESVLMTRATPSLHTRAVGLGGRLCKWIFQLPHKARLVFSNGSVDPIRTHDGARCREAFLLCVLRPSCSSRTFVCLFVG